jgi:hypothetical protein
MEIAEFARNAAGGAKGLVAVKKIYERSMIEVKGHDTSFGEPGSFALARGRGNRLLLVKAALTSLGIRSQIALVRSFLADPEPYRFPTSELFAYPVLVVSVPGEPPVWLDPNLRHDPFGVLPPQVCGQDAAVLSTSRRELTTTKVPACANEPRKVSVKLSVGEDGRLEGSGTERYSGSNAAYLRSGLEPMNAEARQQSIESALARAYRGARLVSFHIDEGGPDVLLSYKFNADGFLRREGDRLVMPNPVVPAHLGQRFVKTAARSVPLLIGSPEDVVTHVEVTLPPGREPAAKAEPINLNSPFGVYRRTEQSTPGQLVVDEDLHVGMQRLAPSRYGDFADFAATIDRAQGRDIALGRVSATPPASARAQ